MKAPDFIHIGPGRTGTTFIYKMLDQHPQIQLPQAKELNFFNQHFDKGMDWYFQKFPDDKVSGEFSNLYFYHPETVALIHKNLPEVKIITVIRNPFERMISNFNYQKRSGLIPPNMAFEEALRKYPDLGDQDKFSALLQQYRVWFGDRFFIGLFDDLSDDPATFFESMFRFLGVDTKVELAEMDEKVNQSVSLKTGLLAKPIRWSANALRAVGMLSLLDKIKNSEAVKGAIYKAPVEEKINVPRELREKINADVDRIATVVNRDLRHWKR